jgi:thiosulfate/3-mercaptopyruvate sulfurtransferase
VTRSVVSTDWLADRLSAPDIVILDASYHLPTLKRDAKAEYLAEHIPRALFFDIDEIADSTNPLPHMLPSPEKFASHMRRMGIGDGKQVIVYDSVGLFSAARAWWMFRVFGHGDVAVLDGGLPKWKAEGRPLAEGPPGPVQERHFTARFNSALVRDKDEVRRAIETGDAEIADARSPARFAGAEPEPRAGLRSGHMPGAHNLHYARLLNPDGTIKDAAGIKSALSESGIDLSRPIVTSCGSGVTAAIVNLGLELVGHSDHGLYDGSWSEWGADPDLPITSEA